MRHFGRFAIAAALVVGAGLTAGPASAAPAPVITVSPGGVTEGTMFTVTGTGCVPHYPVTNPVKPIAYVPYVFVMVDGAIDPTAVFPDSDGTWSVQLMAPYTPGDHDAQGDALAVYRDRIMATCDTYNGSFSYPDATVDVTPIYTTVDLPGVDFPLTPGHTYPLTGSGFWMGEPVDVVLHSDPITLTTLTASSSGKVSGPITLPSDTESGTHWLQLVGRSSGYKASMYGLVVSETTTSSSSTPTTTTTTTATSTPTTTTSTGPALAATGAAPKGMLGAGVLLTLAGGLTLAFARRRTARMH